LPQYFPLIRWHQNKKWVALVAADAISSNTIFLQAIVRVNAPEPRQFAAFWSRTEFLFLRLEERPLLLSANLGVAIRVIVYAGLKDWGITFGV
jgi:hypothetical protein